MPIINAAFLPSSSPIGVKRKRGEESPPAVAGPSTTPIDEGKRSPPALRSSNESSPISTLQPIRRNSTVDVIDATAVPLFPVAPTAELIRNTRADLVSITAETLRGPWRDVRNRLDLAIPESLYMWGPAAESAEHAGGKPHPNSHSQVLYGEFWSEADRSWGGLQCLHAVFQGDDDAYAWLTQSQNHPLKLTRSAFDALHQELTEAAADGAELQALVWAVLCNDLGKTKKLANLYRELMHKEPPDHDRLLGELLEAHPAYFPAFASLPLEEQQSVTRTFKCGCDIAQFLQLEVAPEEVKGLGDLSPLERRLYVLHSKYDVMGAASNFNPNGTVVYTEATHESFTAVERALEHFARGVDHDAVYNIYIEERARLIGLQQPLSAKQRLAAIVAAMTRVTRPTGRQAIELVLNDPKNAAIVDVILQNIGKMHVYYGPALLLNPVLTLGKQVQPTGLSSTPPALQVDERFDPTYGFKAFCASRRELDVDDGQDAEDAWTELRPKVEGLWMGLKSLAQAFTDINALDPRAVGRIPGTAVRQLDVGDIARAMSRPAVIQPGRPAPATRLNAAEMGAAAGIIKPEVIQSMGQLAGDIVDRLRLADAAKPEITRGLRLLPESTQDLLSEAFPALSQSTDEWMDGADLYQTMRRAGALLGLSPTEAAKRYLITLAHCAFLTSALTRSRNPDTGRLETRKLDLGGLIASADLCLRGGTLLLEAQEGSNTTYKAVIKAARGIDTARFESMPDLAQIPGKKILCVGIGGTDGAQAAQFALQLKAAGKDIAGVVSVRGIFTGSPSQANKGVVVPRTIDHHDGELEPGLGVYGVNENTSGTGRMYENVMARDLPVRLLVEEIDQDVRLQVQKILDAEGGVDTVVVVNTSGRVFDADNAQEPRVLRAIASLPDVETVAVVLPLLTDNERFEKFALEAGAKFHAFNDDEATRILATYRNWKMDGSDEHFYSNGAFALQAALTTQQFEGPAAFPYATWLVQHEEQRRNPYKPLNPAMAGAFIMPAQAVTYASGAVRRPTISDLLTKLRAAYPKYRLEQLQRMYQDLHQSDRQGLQEASWGVTPHRPSAILGLNELLSAAGSASLALRTLAQLYRQVEEATRVSTSGVHYKTLTVDVTPLSQSFDPDAHIVLHAEGDKLTAQWSLD